MIDQKRTTTISPDWDDIRTFLAIARAGSLSGAARMLGVNHATVSRRLAGLEAALGGRELYERSREGYALTAAGRMALAEAEAMELAAEGFRRGAAAGDELAGPVQISATATLAGRVLVRPLAELALRHPRLEIDLISEDRNVSLARGEADIAIRLSRPSSGDAVARRVATVDHALHATPDYLAALAPAERRLIGFNATGPADTPLMRRMAEIAAGRDYAFRAATFAELAQAAEAGLGMALLPAFVARDFPALVRARDEPATWEQQMWLMTRSDVKRVARVRLVAEHVAGVLGQALGSR